ncbi:hypothetical protein EJ04DRAFT_580379 [Polyplosphaeria fusca]|uniref:Uncharacterized protein n=1 Tax=Polyplosphaeria fusca TaxID=682080 RepID=A0A9P4QNI7_9PLEO|nr:hypothetical protein EJ04DRAFT_580379 [Polyplosphaeria fusca]
MDFLPKQAHDPSTWADELHSVSGFYGPGVVMSWCLMSVSMLYDANQAFKTQADGFQYFKYATIVFSSLWALCDAVWRAIHTDFGPSYAAALYMSDKGFELGVLLYMLHLFPIRREVASMPLERPPDEELADLESRSFRAQAIAAIEEYKIYPCLGMVRVWVWIRALANGHTVYNVKAQNPQGVHIGWQPLLADYWKPVVASLCLVLAHFVSVLTGWGWWSWGLPVGILSLFAAMHSGLFGTSTPLRSTSLQITETDQLSALVSTMLVLVVQYGRAIPVVRKGLQKMRDWLSAELHRPEQQN